MNLENLDRWAAVAANIGVLIGIVFLVLEIRTNTESNILAVQEAFSSNYLQMNIHSTTKESAELLHKSLSQEELTPVEELQLDAYLRLQLTQGNFIRRLYERGVVSAEELQTAWQGVRFIIQNDRNMERRVRELPEVYQLLLLEEGGIEKYIESVN